MADLYLFNVTLILIILEIISNIFEWVTRTMQVTVGHGVRSRSILVRFDAALCPLQPVTLGYHLHNWGAARKYLSYMSGPTYHHFRSTDWPVRVPQITSGWYWGYPPEFAQQVRPLFMWGWCHPRLQSWISLLSNSGWHRGRHPYNYIPLGRTPGGYMWVFLIVVANNTFNRINYLQYYGIFAIHGQRTNAFPSTSTGIGICCCFEAVKLTFTSRRCSHRLNPSQWLYTT